MDQGERKIKCVDNIDNYFLLSKKMRHYHATQVDASSFDAPPTREDALVKTKFNSKCSFMDWDPKRSHNNPLQARQWCIWYSIQMQN